MKEAKEAGICDYLFGQITFADISLNPLFHFSKEFPKLNLGKESTPLSCP